MTEGLQWCDVIFRSIVAAVMIFMPEGLTRALERLWKYTLIKLGFAKRRTVALTSVARDKTRDD